MAKKFQAVDWILDNRPLVFHVEIDCDRGTVLFWIIRMVTESKFSQDQLSLVERVLEKAGLYAFGIISPSLDAGCRVTPLQHAIRKGALYIVNLMLKHKPEVLEGLDHEDNNNMLHWILDELHNPEYQPYYHNQIKTFAIEMFKKATLDALSKNNNFGMTPYV